MNFTVCVYVLSLVQLFVTPWLLCPWDFPGKNTGVGCHFPRQGIFLTHGSNPRLLRLLPWQYVITVCDHISIFRKEPGK